MAFNLNASWHLSVVVTNDNVKIHQMAFAIDNYYCVIVNMVIQKQMETKH